MSRKTTPSAPAAKAITAGLLATLALAGCSSGVSSSGSDSGPAAPRAADTGWPAYGGDAGGTRYSPLTQISPANVGRLRVAWVFRTGELGKRVVDWSRSAFEATPILYKGTLYFTTPSTNGSCITTCGITMWRRSRHSST